MHDLEQHRDRRRRREPVQVAVVVGGKGQRGDRHFALDVDMKPFPACREHMHAGAGRDEMGEVPAHGEDVLEVVDDEEKVLALALPLRTIA